MPDTLLLVEDNARLAEMVASYLTLNGFSVTVAATGAEALSLSAAHSYDAMILDLMLPDTDGLEVCRQVRSATSLPIIMLTAKGDPMDRIVGLELGADDYLPKPFEPRELLARLRAVLRRGRATETPSADALPFGRLVIDPALLQASVDRRPCKLPRINSTCS